ncbi:MAG TPA: ribosome-associated translation inhibitor RaiA [Sulfurovum sp.]|nr:ribosome-associated translation inhibitor RaiA [Sulfurovum sp.]
MNSSIVGRHFELTEPIKDYINGALEALDKYNLEIISSRVIISGDIKNGKKGFSVEFVVNLKGKHTVVITQKDKDVYAATDLAIERVKKNLRRHSDKIKDHKHISLKELGSEAEAVLEQEHNDEVEPEIVPMDLELHKPMDFDEVIELLQAENRQQFHVFNDHEGIMRVMYKRADGKFGLY